jgi:hypothetical protein
MLALLLVHVCTSLAAYQQTDQWNGTCFFDNFSFQSFDDPTHGYVDFTTRQQAFDWGLVSPGNPSYMGSDHTTVSSGRGRASVRIASHQQWTVQPGSPSYLFALDITHMPTGCGTWPAWWFVGPNWPSGGEIDVLEGVNVNANDAATLHTTPGCSLQSGYHGTGTASNHPNCASSSKDNDGCQIVAGGGSFGAPFNNNKGGVFAMEWNHQRISAWFFPRWAIPGDLSAGSRQANPGQWGQPFGFWDLGANCPYNHFHNLQMVFDLTFCGDWAGSAFGQNCPGKGSCESFVRDNPSAFYEAYWIINFVKIFQG